jgi:hypothetical protein
MQHDTSPHRIQLGGKNRLVQTASLVLCLCRMLFFMFFPRFRRFECKVFLTEAIGYMQGACRRCMIDNTHVVVSSGTGRDMVPAPEMESFGRRFGFTFAAHAVGNSNRSGRVERPFHFIENNFLAGRKFTDWQDANRQARDWCDRVNRSYKRHLKAKPIDLYASERPHLQPLPIYVPDPIEILHRIVDVERFVSVDTNRYSVPCEFIGRTVEVHKSWKQITIYYGGKIVATHNRLIDPADARVLLPEHHFARGESRRRQEKLPEEQTLLRIVPEIEQYLADIRKRGRATTLTLRRLVRMAQEYPREPFLRALAVATQYGLYDLERLERLILRYIADDFFQLSGASDDQGEDNE